jgi:hypothetical protein
MHTIASIMGKITLAENFPPFRHTEFTEGKAAPLKRRKGAKSARSRRGKRSKCTLNHPLARSERGNKTFPVNRLTGKTSRKSAPHPLKKRLFAISPELEAKYYATQSLAFGRSFPGRIGFPLNRHATRK